MVASLGGAGTVEVGRACVVYMQFLVSLYAIYFVCTITYILSLYCSVRPLIGSCFSVSLLVTVDIVGSNSQYDMYLQIRTACVCFNIFMLPIYQVESNLLLIWPTLWNKNEQEHNWGPCKE